uniref:C2 calcium dependent domain containing 6 n=1 Tax=Monodelphis domestica TaxID=13616 RepID=A0A5F8GTH6_MONDO
MRVRSAADPSSPPFPPPPARAQYQSGPSHRGRLRGPGWGVGGGGSRMDPSQMEKKVSEHNQSQRSSVQSLFKVPLLFKDNTGADDDVGESRALDSISEGPSFQRQMTSTRIEPSREGSKEGSGKKLTNVGCLAVHIKKCRHFSPRINLQYYTNLFIRITVNRVMKCTKSHCLNYKNNEKRPEIKFEEVKYFSVQVPRRHDDERNMLHLELMEFDDLEAYPVLLGSFSLHLYEIIQKGCFTEEFFMKIRNLVVCRVEVEFMFSYGNFGYGFSHQLELEEFGVHWKMINVQRGSLSQKLPFRPSAPGGLPKRSELKPLQKLIQPSMFMNVPPPVERTDPLTNVITPQLIEYPAFLSPDLNVTLGNQQKQTHLSSPVRLEKLQQQPRDRLDRMKKEYRNLKTWEEKSNYLDQILRMKIEPKEFEDSKDTDDNDDMIFNRATPFPASFFQTSEFSFKKQEDKTLPSELPVKIPEVKKSLPLVEKRTEPAVSHLFIQEDAKTKNGSLPPEESTPLPPVSIKGKNTFVESIDGRDKPVHEMTEPEGDTSEKQFTGSPSSEVKLRQSRMSLEKIELLQSETRLKGIILSPDRRKKSTDEGGLESKRQSFKQESKKSLGFKELQDLKDIDAASKMTLPRHVSFNISSEALELPSNPGRINRGGTDENISFIEEDKSKDKKTGREKSEDEAKEVVIKHTYVEDNSFRQARPEGMPPFQGCQKPMISRERFEPFLRNIHDIPVEAEGDERIQHVPICTVVKKDSTNAEIIEHEDQDPPYPPVLSSLTVNSEHASWESNPDIFTIKSLDTEEELERGLSKFSMESMSEETAFSIDIDLIGKGQDNLLSELLDLKPSLEKLQKTMVLKSILNDDLNDLSEELFAQPTFIMEIEVQKKTQTFLADDTSLENSDTDICDSAQNEQIDLSGMKISDSKSSKIDITNIQSEQIEVLGKISTSSKFSKHDVKIVQSEQIELSRKPTSIPKFSQNELKIVQSEQIELSRKPTSTPKFSQNELKIVQSEQIELSRKPTSTPKFSQNELKIVQSEQIELSGKPSLSPKFSQNELKLVQSEQIELLGKISSSPKFSQNELKLVPSGQIELLGKPSMSPKFSQNELKLVQSGQIELSGKPSMSPKFSQNELKLAQSGQIELLGKPSMSPKFSQNELKLAQSGQIELSGKPSSSPKVSQYDLKSVHSEQIELSGKPSSSPKVSQYDLKSVHSEQIELSGKPSSSPRVSQYDLKIVQSEQIELSGKPSSSPKVSQYDLKSVHSEQIELSGKPSSSPRVSQYDLKIVQSEQIELLEKPSSSPRVSQYDLKIVQNEQIELSEKQSPSPKVSKSDIRSVHSEQIELSGKLSPSPEVSQYDLKSVQSEETELSGKLSPSPKLSKSDVRSVQSEEIELSGKLSPSPKLSKSDVRSVHSEEIELSGELSSSPKLSQYDLKSVHSEQIELSGKLSPSPKVSQYDLKSVHSEETELSGKLSPSPKVSKSDLKSVHSEQIELSGKPSPKVSKSDVKSVHSEHIELSGKLSPSPKVSQYDLKSVQSEQIELSGKLSPSPKVSKSDVKSVHSEHIELLGKLSPSPKVSQYDLKSVQSEQIELSEKISSTSKSSKHEPKIVQSGQIELSRKPSLSSRSSKHELKIVQSEQMKELSGKPSSSSKSSKHELKIVHSEQMKELSGKPSSSSKSSKHDLKIVQSEQLKELSGKPSSRSSKNAIKIVQSEQLNELSGKPSLSSRSSKHELKIVHSEQMKELSGKPSSSSKSSKHELKIVHSEQIELSGKLSPSPKSVSKEAMNIEILSESQVVGLTEEVEECHISETFEEPEEQPSIVEGDLSSRRKHSFKKKHPEECSQKSSEGAIQSLSSEKSERPEDMEHVEPISPEPVTELDLQHSLTVWNGNLASTSQESHESKHLEVDIAKSKSYVRHIFLQAFPSDSGLDSNIVSVIELDKDHYQGSWVETDIGSPDERSPGIEEFPRDKNDSLLMKKLDGEKSEKKDLSSVLDNTSTYIMHKLSESDRTSIKSFVSNVYSNFPTENITELHLTKEAEVEKEKQVNFVAHDKEHHEEIHAKTIRILDKSDDINVKSVARPKHTSFKECLSGSEAELLTADLNKHIQDFLLERLSGSEKISKEELPKIFENLYLIYDKIGIPTSFKAEISGKDYPGSFSETSAKSTSANQTSFDDGNLQIRLRDLISEILQQYLLRSKYSERESEQRDQNLPPYKIRTIPFSHEVKRDFSEGSLSGESDIRSLSNQSIQDLLSVVSETELVHLKSDLSKCIQSLFIERLSNMGLITEKEFRALNENLSLINSSDRPLKFLSSDLKGLSQILGKSSEKPCYKTLSRNVSEEVIDERFSNAELARKLEREYFALHSYKRKPSFVREEEKQYTRERVGKQGGKNSKKSSQEFLFNNSTERITKLVFRREQKDHNFMQLPQVEKTGFEEEIQDLHGWYNKPKITHSKATVKIKPLDRKDHVNIYKVTVKERSEPIIIPSDENSEIQSELKEYFYKSKLPSSSNSFYLNSDNEEESKLKDQCYGKSKENSKKKPLLTVAQFQKELQAVYVKPKEATIERCVSPPPTDYSSRIVEINTSKPSLFPEVLKTESSRPKFRREREYVEKQKRPLYRTAKILAASQPATRLLLKKSPQRTLLFPWSGKRNIHDSSENKKEELHLTSYKHLEKAKARARFDLGRSPDDKQYCKNFSRPNTAPEFNKRLKESLGKFANPRLVSAGLFQVPNVGLEEYNQRKDLKDLEKCSIICDILQLLNSSYVKRKYEDD